MDHSGLVARARDGDEQAFRDLYRSIHPNLLRYLRVLVGDQDADDIASETWLHLVRGLAGFRGDDPEFHAFAAAVGRNRAIDHLRRERRRPATRAPTDAFDQLPAGADPAALAAEAISTDAALALIASLPTEQAEAVMVRVVMGLDAKAAGRVLGKRPGAVRTATHRGLRRLAALLAVAPEPAPGPGLDQGSGSGSVPAPGSPAAQRPADRTAGVTDPARPALKGMR